MTLGFFGAVSNDRSALNAVIQRTSSARRRGLHRVELGDGLHMAITGRTPGSTQVWITGYLVEDTLSGAREDGTQWGADQLARLAGNFCLAAYDPQLRGLRIARDLAGTQPLYYAVADAPGGKQGIVFGSSATEVLHAAAFPAKAHLRQLQRYLASGALAGEPDSLYQGVRALRRHYCLELLAGTPMRTRQVAYPDDGVVSGALEDAAERAQELRRLLLASIAASAGTGNAAVALSGGIDSSGILTGLRQARGASEPLHAYSYLQRVPQPPPAWDERPWARLAAAHLNAHLHEVELEVGEVPAMLSSVVAAQDFPFSSPVVLAQAKLFQVAASDGVEIMLSGHGPDLLFGGGDSHLALRLSGLIRTGRVLAAARMLPGAAAHAASGTSRFLAATLARVLGLEGLARKRNNPIEWASMPWFRERVAGETEEPATDCAPPREPLHALIHQQLGDSLGSTSLLHEQGNARFCALDNRLPYLVATIVQLSRSCRPEDLVSDRGQTKHLLRRALAGLLPEATLQRRSRIGFAVPVLPWLLQHRPWVEGRYRDLGSLPFFRGAPAHRLWQRLESGSPMAWSLAYRLWRWIVLLEWARRHNVRFD